MNTIWSRSQVSADGTHHLCDGTPIYTRRFAEVLKFHAPGLAPVRDSSGAFHIDATGADAYAERHLRTFGFYEGLAAVHGHEGWFHIRPDGSELSAQRHDWCGNFQGIRCPVRDAGGRYFHITPSGAPAYAARWRYAGDFRDGIAVVQREDGLHSHIDLDGSLIHGRWFEDLDVFHKGLARARLPDGWTHVNARGEAAYMRRFASVEPFYNGQARVETMEGALEVIDEQARTLAQLRAPHQSAFQALSADLVGFWKTEAIAVAVAAGVFEVLPTTVEAAARSTRLATNQVYRLLRALGELGLAQRLPSGAWDVTARGGTLRRSHPESLADAAMEYTGVLAVRWKHLPEALQEIEWTPHDLFKELSADRRRVEAHHRMLGSYARHDYERILPCIPLDGVETVIDAGGGQGVLARLLLDRYPQLSATVYDRPEVVDLVPVERYPGRLKTYGGDLFAPWPIAAEAVVLARVLHDWNDARAVTILRNARNALQPMGQLIVVEMVLDENSYSGAMCDLHLLVCTGGKERTRNEFQRLLQEAGFQLTEVIATSAIPQVILARAK